MHGLCETRKTRHRSSYVEQIESIFKIGKVIEPTIELRLTGSSHVKLGQKSQQSIADTSHRTQLAENKLNVAENPVRLASPNRKLKLLEILGYCCDRVQFSLIDQS